MTEKELRIAISMRETTAESYEELRDSLARDWIHYLERVFPNIKWLYVPNMGESVQDYLKQWDINGIILSGGESLGISFERDETERLIFEYSRKNNLPVLGVCRGMQVIYSWLGGKLLQTDDSFKSRHVSTSHRILIEGKERVVNSYHSIQLDLQTCPKELSPLAFSIEDDSLEAYTGNKILGLMWHPERHKLPLKWETNLIYNLFKYSG